MSFDARTRLTGPAITLVVAVALFMLAQSPYRLPNPPALLVLAIVFSAFHGGLTAGLASAAIAWAILLFFFADPGTLFQYSRENLIRVALWGVTLPLTAVMVGVLKRRAEKTSAAAATHELAEAHLNERIRAETTLQTSNAILDGIFESAPDTILLVSADGRIARANSQAVRMFGYPREAITGKPVDDLLPGRLREGHARHRAGFTAQPHLRAMGSGMKLHAQRSDGSEFPVDVTLGPLRIDDKVLVICIVRDITERVQAEAERKELLDVLEASLNELYIFDPDTLRLLYVNQSALRNLGYSAEAMRAMTPLDLKPEFTAASFRERVAPLLRGEQEAAMFQTHHRRADGTLYPVEVHLQLVGQDTGRVFLAVIFDITERRQAEQALRDYTGQLRQLSLRMFETAENERRRLARELHDRIGQNVAALSLNLSMMRGELSEDCRRQVNARLDDSESLLQQTAQLVRNVLADLRPPGLDELGLVAALKEHARQVAGRVGFSAAVSGSELSLRLPPATEITLFRIVQEAFANIAKHAHATAVAVTLEAGPDTAVLTVADNGCGFDPMARPAQPTSSLGLVSMRERAEAIGARLRIESAPGQGTRVIVEAPRAAPDSSGQQQLPGINPA
jgi:hypothetical protein